MRFKTWLSEQEMTAGTPGGGGAAEKSDLETDLEKKAQELTDKLATDPKLDVTKGLQDVIKQKLPQASPEEMGQAMKVAQGFAGDQKLAAMKKKSKKKSKKK